MDMVQERRTGEDRRKFSSDNPYGCERRNNSRNRRLDTGEKFGPHLTRRVSHAHGRGSDGACDTLKEIAEAFGVHPDTLEMLEREALATSIEVCPSCESQARINAELETELAESRRNLEQYRRQLGEPPR